ncbi:type II toxin-antitoxin system HicB family antitoxin [Nitrospirota bacterium]
MMTFTAVIYREDESFYKAKCPEVGTESQGKSIEEAIGNLKEATEVYLSVFPLKSMGEPIFQTFEVSVDKEKE